jgi:hypothetical protein
MVRIYVGHERQLFRVYKKLLCDCLPYFKLNVEVVGTLDMLPSLMNIQKASMFC